MSWFKRQENEIETGPEKSVRTEGLWTKCDGCKQFIFKADMEANLMVCPKCGRHYRLDASTRIAQLLEPGYEIVDTGIRSTDPLEFVDFKRKLAKAQSASGLGDSILNAIGHISVYPVIVSAMDFAFMGGSLGSASGETLARAIDRSLATRHPLIIVSASGGARMQEGIASLMQLAKVSSGLAQMDDAGIPFISLMTDPTFGGVTASYAMLGDLNIAEPGALIGFTGARVIEQTLRQKLPEGFQRSEFQLEHGMLDAIVPRKELKPYLERALRFMQPNTEAA